MWKGKKSSGNPKAISIGKVELSRNHRHHQRRAYSSLGRSVVVALLSPLCSWLFHSFSFALANNDFVLKMVVWWWWVRSFPTCYLLKALDSRKTLTLSLYWSINFCDAADSVFVCVKNKVSSSSRIPWLHISNIHPFPISPTHDSLLNVFLFVRHVMYVEIKELYNRSTRCPLLLAQIASKSL